MNKCTATLHLITICNIKLISNETKVSPVVVKCFLSFLCVISVRSGSHVSMKSDQSKDDPLNFSEKTPPSYKRYFVCLHSRLYYLSTVVYVMNFN